MNNIELALEKILENPEMIEKLKNCKTLEEIYEIAVSVRDGYTKEEFKDYIAHVTKGIQSSVSNGILNENDLSEVSGGGNILKASKKIIISNLALLCLAGVPASSFSANTVLNEETSVKSVSLKKETDTENFFHRHKRKLIGTASVVLGTGVIISAILYNNSKTKKEYKYPLIYGNSNDKNIPKNIRDEILSYKEKPHFELTYSGSSDSPQVRYYPSLEYNSYDNNCYELHDIISDPDVIKTPGVYETVFQNDSNDESEFLNRLQKENKEREKRRKKEKEKEDDREKEKEEDREKEKEEDTHNERFSQKIKICTKKDISHKKVYNYVC
ncbi:hypothetical protein FACS189465_0280 [Clostridia bacterium]|nr:hypothetical protein FACS189465_0280 [Clostridia bacterium]